MGIDRTSGAALIAGSLALLVTMMFHPTGHDLSVGAVRLAIGVHALAIMATGALLFGFFGLARMMRPRRPLAEAGLVAFAIAAGAGVLAATVSGILGPALHERAADADADAQAIWRVVSAYNFRLNAALAQVFIAATSAAMLIWSASMLRISRGWAWIGVIGIAIAVVALAALLCGSIRNSVHDVGLFIVGFAVWTLSVGVSLSQRDFSGAGD